MCIMIKIKHKELASILGVSTGYSKQLLHRKKIRLSNEFLNEIINLIMEKRNEKHN